MKKYFIMRTVFILFSLTWGVNYIIAQHKPSVSQPYLWVKADSVNHDQNYWVDISGNDRNINFNTIQDSIGRINYQPSLVMDIANPYEISYHPKAKDVINVFAVYKTDTTQSGYSLWSVRLDSNSFIEMNSGFVKDLFGKKTYSNESRNSPIINFYKQSWINKKVDTAYSHLFICGGDSIQSFNGSIAEIIFYNRNLKVKEITKISTYLAVKYGISLKNINYISSDNTILWDAKKDKEFCNEIAVIGKDSMLNINQKQSAGNGGESILKISSGSVFRNWNKENNSIINDGDFILWGDNGKIFLDISEDTLNTDSTQMTYLENLSERRWLIKSNGSTANTIPTLLMLYAPEIKEDTLRSLNLVISRTANFNFPADSSFIIAADSIDTLGNYYFHNIYWDTDNSGSDAFTFQVDQNLPIQLRSMSNTVPEDSSASNMIAFINVFPNPTHNKVTVQVKLKTSDQVSLKVLDELSRVSYNKILSDSDYYEERIYLNSKGVYFLYVETNGQKKKIKIVVQ